MNVFVLSTGRCGSLSFAKACGHLTNYTSGHETRAHLFGSERLDYPDNHIEVDNRLAWFLGPLAERYDDRDVLYVHLTRDPQETAESLVAWSLPTPERPNAYPANMLRAFCHGLTMRATAMTRDEYLAGARAYVDTVSANISTFLAPQGVAYWDSREMAMGDAAGFAWFLRYIKAEGDLDAAIATWGRKSNRRPLTGTRGS